MVRNAVLVVLCMLSLVAWAGPSTQPSHRRGPGGPGMPGGPGGPDGGDRSGPRFWEPREGDWENALKFFQENSPQRAKALEAMPKEKQNRFRGLIIGRYYSYRWMTRENTDVAQNMLRQMRVEDDIFGIKSTLMKTEEDSADYRRLRDDLRAKVRELVDARIEEREKRIESLGKVLSDEKEKLQKDKDQKDQVVEKRLEEILSAESPEAAAGGGPPRRRPEDRGQRDDRGPRGPRPESAPENR